MRVRLWLSATMVLVLAGLATHGTHAGSGDEPHYLAIAHSLAFDHDVDLSNNYGSAEPMIGEGHLAPEMHARPGKGGVLRPVHDIGLPLLFAPYVRIARPLAAAIAARIPPALMRRLHLNPSVLYRHTISAGMIVVAVALGLVLLDVLLTIGISQRTAFWTTLLVALSPPLLIFSILFFTELVSALLCLTLFRLIVIADARRPLWVWGAVGLATGFLVLVHVRNLGLAAALGGIGAWTLFRRGERVPLLVYVSSAAVMLTIRMLVVHHFWGTFVTTPIAEAGEWEGMRAMFRVMAGRFAGLLVDQEYGLLPYAPVFLLAPVGWFVLARTQPRLAWCIAGIAGIYVATLVLPITNTVGWTGGWSPPARFLMPIVPLLAITVAAAIRATPRTLMIAIVAAQVGISAYVWQHPKVLWNSGTGNAAICARLSPMICRILPSLVTTP